MMYHYDAKVTNVVDGDTIDVMVDLGFDTWVKKRVRLAGINAYEARTRDKEEKEKGLRAKARVVDVLNSNGNKIILKSLDIGKYGRCIGEVFVQKDYIRSEKYHGKSLSEMLLAEGHATKYEC